MYDDGAIHIESDDQCFTCEHYLKGVKCPLLEALALSVVELKHDIRVKNCGFYRPFVRHLKLVDTDAPGFQPEDPSNKRGKA